MTSTSQASGDTGGDESSSPSPMDVEGGERQHQRIKSLDQQLSTSSAVVSSNNSNSGASSTAVTHQQQQQQQQLFPKPLPNLLPTFVTDPNTTASTIAANSSIIGITTPPESLLTAAVASLATESETPVHAVPSNSHFTKGEGVKEPRPTDVICGRGKMTASHPANRRFRELVDSHKAAYQNSKRRDEKTRITCELVDKLRGEGRFVLFDPNTKLWHEVSEEYAREKVSHSLRSRSSSEQRIVNAASNSIKMLNNPVHHESNDTVVDIAPRTEEGSPTSSTKVERIDVAPIATKIPTSISSPSSPNNHNSNVIKTNNTHESKSTTAAILSSSFDNIHGTGNRSKSPNNNSTASIHRKKVSLTNVNKHNKTSVHKAATLSTSTQSKHSVIKPGLDDIVKRIIKEQQVLLRGMIQKETERFTSAAAIGSAPRPMPLSYRAEATAVSTLTSSLPKMGSPPAPPVPLSSEVAKVTAPLPTKATAVSSTSQSPSSQISSEASPVSPSVQMPSLPTTGNDRTKTSATTAKENDVPMGEKSIATADNKCVSKIAPDETPSHTPTITAA